MALLHLAVLIAVLSGVLTGEAGKCFSNHWQCDDGACLPSSWRCDGAGDCLDGSDEMDCSCPPEAFECFGDMSCVTRAAVCDGRPQCPDGSDELNCSRYGRCLSSDWTCGNSICIPLGLRCNGFNDCGDNSDEEGCGHCGDLNVRCPNGTCLTLRERCDGVAQCSDGRDEPVTCGKICRDKNGGCSHECTDQLWGATCSCPSGMKLSANGAKCEDIDECAQLYGPCMHKCVNTRGSFQCFCQPGFQLQSGNGCQARGNATKLLATKKGLLGLIAVKDRTFKTLSVINSNPVALTFDLAQNFVFWADRNGSIYKIDDQKSSVIYSGQTGVKSLAVDWLSGQIFWTNSELKGIYTGASDGSAFGRVLSKDMDPTDLVLLPTESSMFWINKGPNIVMTIEKAGMDGFMRSSLVVVTAQLPRGLALDVAARRLYWLSDFRKSVETVKVDGTGRHTIRELFKGRTGQNLAVFNGWFYWLDDRRLWQAPENQPSQRSSVLKGEMSTLMVYHELQQPRGLSPCRKSGCVLCLPSLTSPSGFTCSCSEGTLPAQHGSCENFKLVYSTPTSIYTLEYAPDGPVKSLLFSSDEDIQTFDVDWKREWVIWANLTGHVKALLLREGRFEYIPTLKPVCTVRVDQRTGNLYWVSCDELSVGATYIGFPDQSFSNQLHQASGEINDLFVDWERGQLYWLEDGQIINMKLGLLGGNAKAIYSSEDKSISHIVFDWKTQSFIWSLQNELQVMSLLKMRKYSAGKAWTFPGLIVAAYEPYMVTVHNDVIMLWKRQNGKLVKAVDVESSIVDVIVAMNQLQQTSLMSASQAKCQKPSVLCKGTLLCILQAQICDGTQDCPDGADEAACVQLCSKIGDFQCKDEGKCVARSLVCNKHPDCNDGSDERDCPATTSTRAVAPVTCRLGSKLCSDGSECVLFSHVCDGEVDCKDGSDEEGCEHWCKADQFQCAHGRMCIDKTLVCDGTPQCQDRSDEMRCFTGTDTCSHHCDYKTRCIPQNFLCDGEKDCLDGSDEADFSVSSGTQVEATLEPACKSPSVMCPGTSLCISESQLCDGMLDCPDGFDELHCLHACSDPAHFLCKNRRQCIEQALVCDGRSDCPDGSDELQCPTCPLHCDEGTVCLNSQQFCDGRVDCKDGSDERNCYKNNKNTGALKCAVGFKPCRDGRECVLYGHVCDGEKDCKDGSDEEDCRLGSSVTVAPRVKTTTEPACKSPSVTCQGTSLCISEFQLCDGMLDCPDGFDELHCLHACSDPAHFLCKNKRKCIERPLVCDGRSDCPDGSDELQCPSCPLHCDEGTVCLASQQFCDGRMDCKDGSDEKNCYGKKTTKPASLKCPLGFKPCRDGRECVLYGHVCDGEKDCKDGSDERDCEKHCKKGQFQCAHGRMCINKTLVCDGTPQCQDRSDEMDCFTRTKSCSHSCDDKTRCIPESFLCDGERDCVDGTDEADCYKSDKDKGGLKCALDYKPCRDGSKCILYTHVCDGKKHCKDGSDEEDCRQKSSVTVAPRVKTTTEPACKSPSVMCPGTSLCISESQLCDGMLDCPDGFDELHCLHACSDPAHFLCKNKRKCIERPLVCDGRSDCSDGSDELQCPTCPLHCDEGTVCLNSQQFCDGRVDCKDGSDERNCYKNNKNTGALKCAVGFKPCRDGRECVLYDHVCDGEKDCKDGSDEEDCRLGSSVTVAPRVKTTTEPACKSPSVTCPGTSLCISEFQLCDGMLDCPDGFDELHCLHACSDPAHFLCKNKRKCIERPLVCDGRSDCPDGSDELQCPSCPLHCDEGTVCLTSQQFCDGRVDCKDGSDEKNCYKTGKNSAQPGSLKCPLGFKPCRDGSECVLYGHVCDGEKDCKDGSDETDCEKHCKKGQFQCAHGRLCIDKKLVCDGTPQCQDRSDEMDCFTRTKSCSHRCDEKTRCIPESFLCDGERDCADGTDEADCSTDDVANKNTSSEMSIDLSAQPSDCKSPSMLCESTASCMSPVQLCDGQLDCPDGSDELSCIDSCQNMGDFLCNNKRKCIKRYQVCDRHSDCTDGSDEMDCSAASMSNEDVVLKCRLGSKLCTDGSDCVLITHVCDGEVDCKDGSDEEGCDLQCTPGQFQCSHGRKCIDRKQVCDGVPQCPDNSDESTCWQPTRSCALRCDQNSLCIPEVFICNGKRDCWDGSDETDCAGNPEPPFHCKTPFIPCLATSKCISQQQLCDGRKDCADGSDERPCLQSCPYEDDFLCKDRRRCIDKKLVCDGRVHCTDASDEVDCPTVAAYTTTSAPGKCRLGSKPCTDGSDCILYSHVCDGEVDCRDKSDEEGCDIKCNAGQFQCAHGKKCIDATLVCDGKPHCQDRSDEMDCFKRTKSCSHRCDNKTRCIPENFLCDGERDCIDGTDEADCGYPTQPISCDAPSVLCRGRKMCISNTKLCDGKRDCPDGFDEESCMKRCPKRGDFLCKDKRKCVGRGVVCDGRSDCADGSDEKGCTAVSIIKPNISGPVKCRLGWKSCKDRRECVLYSHVCDGEVDCKDGSDEEDCQDQCKPDQFHCAHGKMCIDKKLVCDGTPQCQDRSDEMDCFTRTKSCSHQCDNKTRCIPDNFVCDGEKDCLDGTDEADCNKSDDKAAKTSFLKCAVGFKPCRDGSECVLYSHVCDGEKDCKDGSDEENCRRKSVPISPTVETTPEPACKSPSVMCPGTSLCISQSQLCDGMLDCPDGFDELHCLHACSDPAHFLCKNKRKCIEQALVCDGRSDCSDGSDELQCPTCPLHCDEGTVCLTSQQFCDGRIDCKDGFDEKKCYKSDKNTTGASSLKCPLGFKPCRDGRECILYSHVCDGEKDCKDGSDEKDCEKQCKKSQFQCAHGKLCIDKKQVCDGTPQCQDRSDEMNCLQFSESCSHHCDNRSRCIPETFLCDGERDCLDGTDETSCAKEQCVYGEFQCASGQCVSVRVRCDGHADCHDQSDEKNCRKPPHCPLEQRCANSHVCLLKEWFCDEDEDCTDGSDEKNCEAFPLQCGVFQWSCASKSQCIPTFWRCDGVKDCKDQSDEAECGPVKCPMDMLTCGSKECLDSTLVCDGIANCLDESDEGPGCLSNNCSSLRPPQCEHYCVNTPDGAGCGCLTGFKIQADGLHCGDVDECMDIQPPVCSHSCINTHGSYICHCPPGFILEPDGSCKTPQEPSLLASVQYEVLFMGLRSSNMHVLFTPGQKPIFSLDYDLREQRVFWVCLQEESIKYAVHGEKSNIKMLVKGVKSDSIAVDWVAGNLYWVDGVAGLILAVRIADHVVKRQNVTVILDEDLEQPRSLVLLPQKGIMLWSQIGKISQIKQAGMDGSESKVLLGHDLNWPIAIAVDLMTDRIYWADEKLKCIGSATMNGEDIRLLQLTETSSPFSVAVFNDMVYWSDTKRLAIHGAHKITGKNHKVILKRPGQPLGLKIVHPLVQYKVLNPCERQRCSHICVLAPGLRALCRCPAGLLLAEDRFTCSPPENSSDSFLLLLSPTRLTKVFTASLHGPVGLKQWPAHNALSLPGINEASALDLVLSDGTLYVADISQASVTLIKLGDTMLTPEGLMLHLPGDTLTVLAVDWITHSLYWSSNKKPQIYVTSADGKFTCWVLQAGLQDATSIALHPPTGRMCFTAIGLSGNSAVPQVDCAAMDGRNPVLLWKKTQLPNFLTFSSQGTTVYWADIATEVICSVDIDGSNYREYKTGTGSPLIVSLTRSENILFWITQYNGTTNVWYSDGIQPKQLWFAVQTNIIALKAYSSNSQKGTNLCAENNGGCSHLCLAYPGGRTCRCTEGFIAINDVQCIPGLACPSGSKPCQDKYKCLSTTRFCDQIQDCQDGSDEEGCLANENQVLVDSMGGKSCNAEFCNSRGRCVIQKGKPVCECVPGYNGQFCQDATSSSVPVVLTVLFIICLVIAAAAVLKWRRWKSGRSRSSDKETLMKDMDEQDAYPDNFSNELYNPLEEQATPVE